MPRHDDLPVAARIRIRVPIGLTKTEPPEDRNRNTNTAPAPSNTGSMPPSPPIPTIVSSLPSTVTSSSTTSATRQNPSSNQAVPDSVVSSSASPGPAPNSSSLPSTTSEGTRNHNCLKNEDRKIIPEYRQQRYNKWKTGDWCWLKDEKEDDLREEQQEAVLAKQDGTVREEKETDLLSDRPAPSPVRNSLCSSRQVKRKAAAAISSVVDDYGDEDSDEDYEVDSTMDCEEYYELGNNCSNFEIQGPKPKKATKRPHGNTDGKNGMQCTNC
mmetsp:Transcript_4520/g.9358  ORF Transcript_4520/g.9358 Transcript_4520/m.9358 type:complete len:270 (-) Transcript_4520:62-871(-)